MLILLFTVGIFYVLTEVREKRGGRSGPLIIAVQDFRFRCNKVVLCAKIHPKKKKKKNKYI